MLTNARDPILSSIASDDVVDTYENFDHFLRAYGYNVGWSSSNISDDYEFQYDWNYTDNNVILSEISHET